jgi:hypothetical protein
MCKIERLSMTTIDRKQLEQLVSDRNAPQKVVWRANIALAANEGMAANAIAATVGRRVLTLRHRRRRYDAVGVDGLIEDATRPPRRKPLVPEQINAVVNKTPREKPANATHWSVRRMAAATGLSRSSVQRIRKAHELKPHRVKTFRVSRDRRFVEKVEDDRGPIRQSAGQGSGVVGRREEPDPGARSDPTQAVDEVRAAPKR